MAGEAVGAFFLDGSHLSGKMKEIGKENPAGAALAGRYFNQSCGR
jgi:hypothetical protein